MVAVPIILNIIEDSKKSAYKVTLNNILSSTKIDNIDNKETKEYKLKNGRLVTNENEELDLKGDLGIDSGVKITKSGNIYAYMYKDGYCTLKRGKNNDIEQFKTDKELCNMDIATNLVVNGYGEYKDNTNFSQFTYEEGVFKTSLIGWYILGIDQYIPIDTSKAYYEEVSVKTTNKESKYYAGTMEFDADNLHIESRHVYTVPNTLTYLVKNLNNGDTEVYLNSTENFVTTSYSNNILFWNYKDSNGYMYPELTYSRNYSQFNLDKIDKENNKITLIEPWDGGIVREGTKVSQSTDGSVFNYGLYVNKDLTDNYQTFTNIINGVNSSGFSGYDKFRSIAVNYIKFSTINNVDYIKDVTTYYKNIIIKEIDD